MPDWLRKLFGLKTKQEEKAELERIAEQRIMRERISRELKARAGKSHLGKLANSQAVYRPSVDGTIRGQRADVVITDDVTPVVMSALLSEPSSHSSLSSLDYGESHSASHSCDSNSSSYDFSSSSSCDSGGSSYSYD